LLGEITVKAKLCSVTQSEHVLCFYSEHLLAEFLLAFGINYVSVLYRFWDIVRYLSKVANFSLLLLYLAPPLWVTPLDFHQET